MENEANNQSWFHLSTLASRKCILASATAVLLLMLIINAVVTYFLIDETMHITKIFQLFSLPHYTVTLVLILDGMAAINILIVMCVSLFYPRSSIWKITISSMGFIESILLCVGVSMIFVSVRWTNFISASDIKEGIIKYRVNVRMTEGIEAMQSELQCCGIYKYGDWRYHKDFVCAASTSPFKCGIPRSCCKQYVVDKSKIKDALCGLGSMIVKSKDRYGRKVYIVTPNQTELFPEDVMFTNGCYARSKQAVHDCSARLLQFILILLLTQCFSVLANYFAIHYLKKIRPIARESRGHYRANNSVVHLEQPESQNDIQQPDIHNSNMVCIENPRNLQLGATCSYFEEFDYIDDMMDSGKGRDDSADANKKSFIDAHFQPVPDRIASMANEEGATCSWYHEVDHNVDVDVDKVEPTYGNKSSISIEYYEPMICGNVNPFEAGTDGKKGSDTFGYYQPMMSRIPKRALDKKPEGEKRKVTFL